MAEDDPSLTTLTDLEGETEAEGTGTQAVRTERAVGRAVERAERVAEQVAPTLTPTTSTVQLAPDRLPTLFITTFNPLACPKAATSQWVWTHP